MKHLALVLAVIALPILMAADGLAESKTSEASRKLDPQSAIKLSQGVLGRKLANFQLVDSSGNAVSTKDFRGKPLVARQLAMWSRGRIERALGILNRAIVDSRLKASLAPEIVGQAMLANAAIGAASRRRAG